MVEEKIMEKVKGYKLFNPDWTCQNYQFEVGKIYEYEGEIKLGIAGFHFCRELKDCYEYYPKKPETNIAEVEVLGDVMHGDDGKSVTSKIKIVKELTWDDALKLTNTGIGNSSLCNSGNWNSGEFNSGNHNSGDCNSGEYNTGYRNSGNWNSGYCNSGNHNSGNHNSGEHNSGNYNSGVFCQSNNPKISIFDQPSDWTYGDWAVSRARMLLGKAPFYTTRWIYESDMSEAEKTAHPEAHTLGGYLKRYENQGTHHWQEWWDKLNDEERTVIKEIPNWTAKAWKEITGIEVEDSRNGD